MREKISKKEILINVWIRIRTFILGIFFMGSFLLALMIGHIGPWMIDPEYYPPHLTWDGSQSMATSVTINFKSPSARCGVEYQEVYDNGSLGSLKYLNESSENIYHHLTLTDLKPNTKYKYRIFEISNNLNSRVRRDLNQEYTFKTAQSSTGGDFNFRFIVFGDNRLNVFGTGQNPEINSAILREQNISFVINTGDLVLMGGGPDFWWKRYFMENSYMRSLITLPTKGNHEVFGIESDFNNTEYEKNHAFPNHENWYAVNYSNVHFICLEFTNYRAGAVGDNRSEIMKLWLRHDLSQINTTNKFDFIVVYMHYPLQTLLGGNGVNMDTWEKYAGSEFRMAHVVPDIVFTGHVHDYERSLFDLGDYNGDGHDDYCWNIVSGGGGAELAPARWTSLEPNYYCVELVHHYCTVDVNGKSLVLNAKTATGAVFDHLEINKS